MLATTRFRGTFWHISFLAALLALLSFSLFQLGATQRSVAHAQVPPCGPDTCGWQPPLGVGAPPGHQATVTKGHGCIVPSALDDGMFVGTTDTLDVRTSSGTETLTCHAQDKIAPGRAAQLGGIPCQSSIAGDFTPGIVYESATGKLTFKCHFPPHNAT